MKKTAKNKEIQRLLRLPEYIDKAVRERAGRNQRSINKQIVFELDHETRS